MMSNFKIWMGINIVLLVEFAAKRKDHVLKTENRCFSVEQERALAKQFPLSLYLLVFLGQL